MPFNPGNSNISGQILGNAIGDAGSNLQNAIEQHGKMVEQYKTDSKALDALYKSHPEILNQMGINEDQLHSMGIKQKSEALRGGIQALQLGSQIMEGQANVGLTQAHTQMLKGAANAKASLGASRIYDTVYQRTGDYNAAAAAMDQYQQRFGSAPSALSSFVTPPAPPPAPQYPGLSAVLSAQNPGAAASQAAPAAPPVSPVQTAPAAPTPQQQAPLAYRLVKGQLVPVQ